MWDFVCGPLVKMLGDPWMKGKVKVGQHASCRGDQALFLSLSYTYDLIRAKVV
jgi:hypothetical protein